MEVCLLVVVVEEEEMMVIRDEKGGRSNNPTQSNPNQTSSGSSAQLSSVCRARRPFVFVVVVLMLELVEIIERICFSVSGSFPGPSRI
jgi:hypothetical protein